MMVGRATAQRRRFSFSRRQRITFGGLLLAVCFLACPGLVMAQVDICGCTGNPNNLGDFNTADEATYPPGTTLSGNTITIPLPDDGILIFDSFTVGVAPTTNPATVVFEPNEINTPVTILVSGDVTIASSSFTRIHVNGQNGTFGSSSLAGRGGLGGPGGFRGGDGAYQLANGAIEGGAGFGPKGGLPGTASPLTDGLDGAFAGVRELLPLIGGGGGGGGASSLNVTSCSGGGGGGGGGGLLIAANGTITIAGQIQANGGVAGGIPGGSAGCATRGGTGSGGAIRLVASTITGTGSITATGGSGSTNAGFIRLEAFNDTYTGSVNPVAMRFPGPGPLSNPLRPTVAITAVNGEIESIGNGKLIAQRPQGALGLVDIRLAAPGTVDIDLETTNIPIGTLVEVTVKPRIGGAPVVLNATLQDANCEATGMCVASVAVNLTPGAYVIEARATFATP